MAKVGIWFWGEHLFNLRGTQLWIRKESLGTWRLIRDWSWLSTLRKRILRRATKVTISKFRGARFFFAAVTKKNDSHLELFFAVNADPQVTVRDKYFVNVANFPQPFFLLESTLIYVLKFKLKLRTISENMIFPVECQSIGVYKQYMSQSVEKVTFYRTVTVQQHRQRN